MQLHGWMNMQVCGYATRRETDTVRHVALWFPAVQHLAVALLFSHPIPVGIGYWFYSFFHTLCH